MYKLSKTYTNGKNTQIIHMLTAAVHFFIMSHNEFYYINTNKRHILDTPISKQRANTILKY